MESPLCQQQLAAVRCHSIHLHLFQESQHLYSKSKVERWLQELLLIFF